MDRYRALKGFNYGADDKRAEPGHVVEVIRALVPRIPRERTCICSTALQGAVVS